MEGAQAAVHEEAIERAGHGAHRVLDEAHPLVQRVIAHDDGAAHDVRVAAEVLGGRVHHRSGAVAQWLLDGGGGERVVDHHQGVAGALDDGSDVDDVEQRVGRGLDPNQPRLAAQRATDGVEIGLVDEVIGETEAAEDLVDQAIGAAVEIQREHDVIARRAGGRDQRVLGGHAARKAGGEPALQRTQRSLERGTCRVRRAGVLVVDGLAGRTLDEGGGLVDRRDDGAVRGVGFQPGMDRPSGEPGVVGDATHLASDSSRSARVTIPAGRPSWVTSRASRSPTSRSTASRTESPADTAGNGGSMTSTISADSSAESSIACLSRPRSDTAPTTVCGSWPDTTGSCDTPCSCNRATASRTLAWVSTVSSGGSSAAPCLAASTSPTLCSTSRSRKPYCRIQASL